MPGHNSSFVKHFASIRVYKYNKRSVAGPYNMLLRLGKILLFAFIFFSFTIPQAMAQCAMCRASVESNVNNGNVMLAAKLNAGILYLFVIPYILAATLIFLWFRRSRSNYRRTQAVRHRLAGIK